MKMLNRIVGGSIAVAAVFVLSASIAQADPNLLVNGDFENAGGFTSNAITLTGGGVDNGWALFGAVGQSDMTLSAYYPESGTYSLLEQNNYGNNWNPVGGYQIVPVSGVESTYQLSGYLLSDTHLSWGPNPVDFQISFLDANLTDMVTGDNGGFNSAPGNGTWQWQAIRATAPYGAVYVVVYAMFMDNGQLTTENIYFDNMDLQTVPEPTTLALLGIGLAVPFYFIRRKK